MERAGDARKVSVAQVLVYELRVRDAMTRAPVTARPEDSLRSIQQLIGDATVALAKEQQFDLVLAKQASGFSSPKLDISDQVIERLKKGGK